MTRDNQDVLGCSRQGTKVAPSRHFLGAVSVGIAAMLLQSCTVMADGVARPATGLKPQPISGNTLKEVLPNAGRLQTILHQPVAPEAQFPRRSGDLESMPNGAYINPKSSPRDCLGMVDLQQNDFRGAPVQNFVEDYWLVSMNPNEVPKAFEADTGVVALTTAADAEAVFTSIKQKWTRCVGAKITIFKPNQDDDLAETLLVSDVRAADSTVSINYQANDSDFPPYIQMRTLGVRANCIVQAGVEYGREPDNSSSDAIAHAMMDEVSRFS